MLLTTLAWSKVHMNTHITTCKGALHSRLPAVAVIQAHVEQPIDTSRVVASWGEPSRAASVACLSSLGSAYVAAARPGCIDILDASSGATLGSLTATSRVAGAALLHGKGQPSLLTCNSSGGFRLHTIQHGEAQCSFHEEASWQAQSNIECMAVDDGGHHAALACQGSELGLWDLKTQQRSYHAKGGRPNKIQLVDKPHSTAVAFLPGSNGQRVVVGTAYHKLRLYDVKARRPVLNLDFEEARVTALAPQKDGLGVWAANGMGRIECLDLRMNKLHSALKGPAGAVKSLALHPQLPVIASVGLDRFFRLHDTASRKVVCKIYLKQQSTAVVWGETPAQAQLQPEPVGKLAAADMVQSDVQSDMVEIGVERKMSKARQAKTHADRAHKKRKHN